MTEETIMKVDAVVLGAGISGVVTAKCLKEAGLSVVILERTGGVGGLWTFRENDYGVMRFTHLIFSKYSYCFSDFPFPEQTTEYPHNRDLANHIVNYVKHFNILENIRFNRKVLSVKKTDFGWEVKTRKDGPTELDTLDTELYQAKYVAIATGHHAKPSHVIFPGQDSFPGPIIHSVNFNDVISNGMTGKRVLIVGIGNSAVDTAVNCVEQGRCKSVYVSARSGAWVIPNYIFGYTTDLYICRLFFLLPWRLANFIFETIIKLVSGNPNRWGLNPKMGVLQTQFTVCPTLIHHIQRRQIQIVPNIQRIEGNRVFFMNSQSEEFDHIVLCTGYKIDLPFLDEEIRQKVLDEKSNEIKLYKNVFSPEIGASLAFIGFVQPSSGGALSMSEIQARWLAEICNRRVHLPSKIEMENSIQNELADSRDKFYHSTRHTIQRDPLVYNDEIAAMFGAKPMWWRHLDIAWRLLLGLCGPYQWRLEGPHSWPGAKAAVKNVPVTDLMKCMGVLLLIGTIIVLCYGYVFISCYLC